jgi:deoxyribodipyrimidine photolyase
MNIISQNRDERIREVSEQIYGASSVLHPGRVTGATEVPSNTPTSNYQTEETSSRSSTPIISHSIAPKPETEGAVPPTEGVTTPSGGGELRRSTRSTTGKFQTVRYADVFLAQVEDYENQSNYSQMAYLSELKTYWHEGTVKISDPRVYAAKKTRDTENPSFHEAIHGFHQE